MKNVTTSLALVLAVVLVSWSASAAFAQATVDIPVAPGNFDETVPWDLPEIDESMSVKDCVSGAEKGEADAQIELALRYYEGKGVEKDKEKAMELAKKSADQENGKALYFLAYMENGSKNTAQALGHLKMSADKGYVLAQREMGIIMYSIGNYEQAYQWHLKAAKQGNIMSSYECGAFLLAGQGVKQDLKEAVSWLRKAAETGFMPAQFELGVCYAQGEGVEQSYEESFKWISKSAKQNHPRSFLILGMYYIKGMGVDQDVEKGYKCIVKAANLGSKEARAILRQIHSQLDDEDEE